ncbi:MAG: malate dehydrogenase, partial [Rhodospirillaceae bacterium]|nr:malate dehydrogenase [Rhodospirillaceae bacterium]
MMGGPQVLVSADGVTAAIQRIFEAAGGAPEEAEAIASNLVGANLAGHDSHGIVRVPRYLMWAETGNLHFGRSVESVIDGDAFALLDGNKGFGQVIGCEAVDLGIAKANHHGVAVVALRRSGHLGRIGHWAEIACDAGLTSIHFVNVAESMLVAPFGAAERRISTAPVTIGVVNPGGDDFILDFATSKVAEGKILVAVGGGKPPPEGALVDGNGQPTLDPHALYGDIGPGEVPNPRAGAGALLAMGDHKGSGLALACELLGGALTGSGTTGPGTQTHNGMLSIYIKPEAIDDGHGFGGSVANYIDFVRSARPADPDQPVMVPGDPERQARKHRSANGLPLTADT